MRNRIRLLVGLVAVLGLVVVSCGEPVVDYEPQTLEEFMGWDDFDERAAYEAWNETSRRIQELTVECMAAKGLEYTPFGPYSIPENEIWLDSAVMSESEFKLHYGYGFFATMLNEYQFNVEHSEELAQENPNWVFAEGETPEGVDYWAEAWACEDEAELEVRGETDTELVPALEEAWTQLGSALEELREEVENDSRLADAEEQWAACMAEKGYDFASEEDIFDHFSPMMNDLEEKGGFEALMEGAIPVAEIEVLAQEELAIAADDVACRTDLDIVYKELQAEYGGKFIAEHFERLEEIRVLEQQFMQMRLEGKEPE